MTFSCPKWVPATYRLARVSHCLAFSIACREMAFIRDWQPLPPAFSQASTSDSGRVVFCYLTGRQCPCRFIFASCASVSSGISLVSISLSGFAAKRLRLFFCASVKGGSVSRLCLTVFILNRSGFSGECFGKHLHCFFKHISSPMLPEIRLANMIAFQSIKSTSVYVANAARSRIHRR